MPGRMAPPMPESCPAQWWSSALTIVPSGLPAAGWTTIDVRSIPVAMLSLSARLAYPVRDGIPVMLEHEARSLSEAEVETARAKRPVDTTS